MAHGVEAVQNRPYKAKRAGAELSWPCQAAAQVFIRDLGARMSTRGRCHRSPAR